MTAVDQKDRNRVQPIFQVRAERDPDVDTVRRASLATDQLILEMGSERRALDIRCR